MKEQNNDQQQQPASAPPPRQGTHPATADTRDEKIKNEPDTARLRSERQSVIDGEQQRKGGQ